MKIRFANDTSIPEGEFKAGSTHEFKIGTARSLIHRGKAVAVTFHGKEVGTRPSRGRKTASAEPTSAAAETTTPSAQGKGKE